ncbi:hypothetical protein M758_UG074300 [Ceratodon purpureus]|nr:hypothetical protein M758_UG074300 [Ceratodon purpureus]
MERLEAEDLLQELENYSPRQFDLMNPLLDLTSGRKNLMSKYLDLHEEEPWPLLAEYFGVALAFAALGALIRGANGKRVSEDVKDAAGSPIPQRTALQTMLKGAMERLQYLAQNAQDLQERLLECTEAKEVDRNDWDEEKNKFLQRIAEAEDEVRELKKRRGEDAKANEKVVRIYSTREHGWKSEKKKLRHEIDMLRKDLIRQEASGFCSPRDRGVCDECELKERRLIDLEKILKEREFIIMSAMDDARSREAECVELTSSLAAEKVITAELNQKLENEISNSAEREQVLGEVRDRKEKAEFRLVQVEEELDTTKSHLEALSLASEDHSAMSQKLLKELGTLKQESEDKDVMISTILERATVEREEKEDLARELAAVVSGKQIAETESGRWKRLAEERTRQKLFVEVPDARSGHRSHRSLGNRSDLEKIADLQKLHAEEVNSLRATYTKQVETLEKQVAGYKGKAQSTASSPIPSLMSADLLEPLADPAFKAWFEVVKGRFATQLEEKHWNQIETFERHLRAKDERLSAFRSKLISMESELDQLRKGDQGCNSATSVDICSTGQKSGLTKNILKDIECAGYERMTDAHQRSMEKLRVELKNARDKLNEQSAEQMATVEKMTENFHAELQNKDVQLAVLEAKLCQVQLQLEEAKLANEMTSSDKSEEEMFLDNIDETSAPQREEELCSTPSDNSDDRNKALEFQPKTVEKREQGVHCEEFIKLDDSVSDSARLLSRLKDMCLKEEKPPAMIRFHRKLELETADSLIFSTDDCWLTAEQKTGEMSLQFLPADDIPQPEMVASLLCEDKNITYANNSLPSQCGRDTKTLVVHKKAKKGVNKQPLSSLDAVNYSTNARQKFDDILFTQAPSKGTRPARFDMSNMLEEQKSQRTLFTEIEGLQSPITNPTFIQESDDKLDLDEERKKSRTREDIQVLGLALEVRRIEQQLSQMNASIGDAHTMLARSVRSVKSPVKSPAKSLVKSPVKQTKRYTGLAGKVSQLAKQIGLTRPLRKAAPKPQTETVKKECAPVRSMCKHGSSVLQSDLCLRKNPLFTQESSAADLASLQRRAEKVGENLSAIQARLAKESSPDYYEPYKPSLFPKGKLVDTVRSHLSQVQGALHSRLSQTTTNSRRPLQLPAPKPCSTPTKPSALTPRKLSPPAKQNVLTPRKLSTPTKPAIPPRKPLSPTNPPVTPSPRRITSTKLLTPSPRSFTPSKPSTQALGSSERRALGSPSEPTQVTPKIATMRDLIKADPRSRAAFPRKLETKSPSIHDQQPRQWARKTSTHFELDLEHLR